MISLCVAFVLLQQTEKIVPQYGLIRFRLPQLLYLRSAVNPVINGLRNFPRILFPLLLRVQRHEQKEHEEQ